MILSKIKYYRNSSEKTRLLFYVSMSVLFPEHFPELQPSPMISHETQILLWTTRTAFDNVGIFKPLTQERGVFVCLFFKRQHLVFD